MELITQAQTFLRTLGISVPAIPVAIDEDGKRPLIKYAEYPQNLLYHDTDFATLPTYVQAAWEKAHYYGVVVNKKYSKDPKTQIIIIDVDIPTKGGHKFDGRPKFEELPTPPTMVVQTKSGGLHVYYYAPYKWRAPRAPFPGIDLAGNSPPFVVGPNGVDYVIIKDLPIVEAPSDLREILTKASADNVNVNGEDGDRGNILDYIKQFGISNGERHDIILSLMASLAKQRVPRAIIPCMGEWARSRCASLDGAPTIEEMAKMHQDAVDKFVEPTSLDELLNRYALVSHEDKIYDLHNRHSKRIGMSALRAMYPTKVPFPDQFDKNGNPKYGQLGDVWMQDSTKHVANQSKYFPGKPKLYDHRDVKCLNTYVPPEIHPAEDWDELYIEKVKRCLKLTYGPIYEDFLKVVMYKYHNPEVKFNWAIYVTSEEEGMGKGLSFAILQRIFGHSNCADLTLGDTGNNFNSALASCVFARIDEAEGARPNSTHHYHMENLKRIITEDVMTVERKGVDKEIGLESFFFLFIFSNNKYSIEVNAKSRRFLIYHNDTVKTPEMVKIMREVGDSINDPHNIAMIVKWMQSTVDWSIMDDFIPKGEARKTDDLLSSSEHGGMSPIATAVVAAIDTCTAPFDVDVLTDRQLKYFFEQEFRSKNPEHLYQELFRAGILKTHKLDPKKYAVRRYNQHQIDWTCAKDNLDIRDAYRTHEPKRQAPYVFIRNYEDLKDAPKGALIDHVEKYGPRKSSDHMHSVD